MVSLLNTCLACIIVIADDREKPHLDYYKKIFNNSNCDDSYTFTRLNLKL